MTKTEQATREWDAEVDEMAAKLIQGGIAPFDAVREAPRQLAIIRRAKLDAEYFRLTEKFGVQQ